MAPAMRPRMTSTTMISISVIPRAGRRGLRMRFIGFLPVRDAKNGDTYQFPPPSTGSTEIGTCPHFSLSSFRHEGVELHDRHENGKDDERDAAAHGHDHHRLEQRSERRDAHLHL